MKRKEKQAQTRAALLAAAAEVFCRRGLAGASVGEIAEAAGFTKGAFYSNFKSKEELFLVMLDQWFAVVVERIDAALTDTGEPVAQARHAAEDFVRFARKDPERQRLYFEFVAHALRHEEFRRELAARHRRLRGRIVEVCRRWSPAVVAAATLPIEEVTAMVDVMTDGFLLDQLIDPQADERLYGTMLMVFLTGLQALAAGWEPPDSSCPQAGVPSTRQ